MRPSFSPRLLVPLLMTFLLPTPGWSATDYDACLKEEQRLRLAEAEACNGLNYIVNPSACFNIRKQLPPYDRGKCREVAVREGVVEPKAEPARAAAPPAADAPIESGAADQAIAELKKEVAALREEIGLLKKEIATLKGERQ